MDPVESFGFVKRRAFQRALMASAALLAAACAGGSAWGMGSTSETAISCAVNGSAFLPAEIGGEAGVCSAIRQAARPVLDRTGVSASAVSISVVVKSKSLIAAVASIDGKPLPEQKVGTSDRPLNLRAITMLADAIAAELGNALPQ